MKKLVTEIGEFKYFNSISVKQDRYICDGRELPKSQFGSTFEIVDEEPVVVVVVEEVPSQITPRQCRLQLLTLGLLDEVETMCSANREMQIWFEYSLDFQRNHPMIEAMAVQLGLTQDELDTMFIEASKL